MFGKTKLKLFGENNLYVIMNFEAVYHLWPAGFFADTGIGFLMPVRTSYVTDTLT